MKLVFLVFILSFVTSFVCGQVTSTSASRRNDTKAPQVEQSEAAYNKISIDAGRYFKQGLLNIQDNRRLEAGEDFDKSVEVFLMSGVDVSRNAKLQSCYNQLTETIYRMEFPSDKQQVNIRSLSATCGWNVENELADKIAKIFQIASVAQTGSTAVAATSGSAVQNSGGVQGFTEQKFEGSKFISSEDGYLIRRDVTPGRRLIQSNQVNSCQNSDSPIIQGLRFDTPISLIKRDSKLDFSKVKNSGVFVAGDSYAFSSPNKNVKSLSLTFHKNNLMTILVDYSSEIYWSSLEEFRQKIVDTLGISGTWATGETARYGTQTVLECKDFRVILYKAGQQYSLVSTSKIVGTRRIKDMIEASKEKAKIQQRRKETFKP